MKNKLVKKGIVVVIIFLFISMSVASSARNTIEKTTKPATFDGNTLYVGGSGEGNYTRIQDAIDNASVGDTIYVYSRIYNYYENVNINKDGINLIGENRNTTVIDGDSNDDDVIKITANNVTVNSFYLQNAGGSYRCGIRIGGDYNTISNNNIFYNERGIYLSGSFNNIFNNNISHNNGNGINIYFSCKENIIQGNIISNNDNFGIHDSSSYKNYILNNKVFKNGRVGIISDGENCIIRNNEVFSNMEDGIVLLAGWVSNNVISGNNVYRNLFTGITVQCIFLGNANNIEISNNNIEYNLLGGLSLWGATLCNIKNNNIYHNLLFNAKFLNSFICKWDGNYWGPLYKGFKIIRGSLKPLFLIPFPGLPPWAGLISIPMRNFDLNPAKEPYTITTAQVCGIE